MGKSSSSFQSPAATAANVAQRPEAAVAGRTAFAQLFDHTNYAQFAANFAFAGDGVYELLFDLCKESIKTKKRPVAIANLKNIFRATFKICSQRSFEAMSLRELSTETGISMGGLYACLQSKQDVIVMAQAVVDYINSELEAAASTVAQPWQRLQKLLRTHIYISTPLQPWFFLLYFETHSLEPGQQQKSKHIEMRSLRGMQLIIQQGIDAGEMHSQDALTVASVLVAMLQDWYLKPWKYRELGIDADTCAQQIVATAAQLLRN